MTPNGCTPLQVHWGCNHLPRTSPWWSWVSFHGFYAFSTSSPAVPQLLPALKSLQCMAARSNLKRLTLRKCWHALSQVASSLWMPPLCMVVSVEGIQGVDIPHANKEVSVNPCILKIQALPGWQILEPPPSNFATALPGHELLSWYLQ